MKPIKDVRPEDLLGRKIVRIDMKAAGNFIKGKNVLITGSGGAIGAELCREVARLSPKMLIAYDHNENDAYLLELEIGENYPNMKFQTIMGDIQDIGFLKHVFSEYKPHIVFHSAAHKHVPLMEKNPAAAVKNNIIGTRNVIDVAEYHDTECVVMISTDKALNPAGVMGASKRIAEMIMQARAKASRTRFTAVRFGNVIGSNGSVIPIFKRQISSGGPITVTHPDSRRFFMTAREAAQLIIKAGAIGSAGEIFMLDMGRQIKVTDIAKKLIKLSGLRPGKDIKIKFIGLRPGEKIFDEELIDRMRDKATACDKIFVRPPDDFDRFQLNSDINALEKLTALADRHRITEKIKEIIRVYDTKKSRGHKSEDRKTAAMVR